MVKILFQDNDILAVLKPVGIDSEKELPEVLKELTGNSYIAVLHRLDTTVSGVMIFAKNKTAAANISKQITSGEFKKEYLAVISGTPTKSNDTLTDLLFKDSRINKSFVVKSERKGVKKAILSYETLNTVHLDNGDISLIKVLLHTGRTHQIRVQFANIGHALIGDNKYGKVVKGHSDVRLWGYLLKFKHPTKDEIMEFSIKPDWL